MDRGVAPRAVARADHCVANQVGRRVRDPEASRRVVVFRAVLALFVGVGVVARVRRVVGHYLGRQQRDDEVGAQHDVRLVAVLEHDAVARRAEHDVVLDDGVRRAVYDDAPLVRLAHAVTADDGARVVERHM